MAKQFKENKIGYSAEQSAEIFNKSGLKKSGTFPRSLKLSLAYLPIEMFDIQGVRKTPLYLIRLLEQCSWCEESPADTGQQYVAQFALKHRMEIRPSFYSKTRCAYPLVTEQSIDYIKRTSRYVSVHLRERDHPTDSLVTVHCLNVNIDPETKQPKPYPDHWKRRHSIPSTGPSLDVISPVKPKANVAVEHNTVRFTDVDENQHTNYVSYIRMCLDAFYENIVLHKYPNRSHVFLNGWLKCMTVVFKKDSILGDILTVESWGDETLNDTFHFEIVNGDTVAVAVTLQFYTSLVESSRL